MAMDYRFDTWRLVMTLPFNGNVNDAVEVREFASDDGARVYVVVSNTGHVVTFGDAPSAFTEAFSRAAWGMKVREMTARDYK